MTRFDRRALFASGAAAALLAATGMAQAVTPRRGGNLRLAVPRVEEGLTPVARLAVYETLTELTPDGLLSGRLATGWQAADAGQIWDLSLRADVVFHDGAPMLAEDVAVSLNGRLPGLVRAEPLAQDVLRLTLAAPDPQIPIRLADPALTIHPAWDPEGAALIGTGHYSARHRTAGGGLVALRADSHAGPEAGGWADRVDIIAMSDPQGRAEALTQQSVDGVLDPAPLALGDTRGLRHLPDPEAPGLTLRDTVGTPAGLTAGDARLAERLWLL